MTHALSNQSLSIADGLQAAPCTTAVRKLNARMIEEYGLRARDLDTLDATELMRTAATLDFLANNLPRKSDVEVPVREPCTP